ncbi:hypothetical protein JTB14_008419 [Gonioctena quinquepunctata]|nr:hypothetical protein JTB14_008419 [Gonioctena quinquepunctata]
MELSNAPPNRINYSFPRASRGGRAPPECQHTGNVEVNLFVMTWTTYGNCSFRRISITALRDHIWESAHMCGRNLELNALISCPPVRKTPCDKPYTIGCGISQ